MLKSAEIREKYLRFFESKGHVIVPSASLVPENDPSTLFTGSGMQPMVPYLLGEKHPLGTRIVNAQKCFRAGDIEEVGDNRHTTCFEMLGNWSFGDYFKAEQIPWMFEFLTGVIGLDPQKIFVTVFRGNDELGIARDTEAVDLWKKEFAKLGLEARDVDFAERDGMGEGRIFYYDAKKNWWSRVGVPGNMPVGEPGGPDSEMFWDFGPELRLHENSPFKDEPCHVNCDCGRFLEIGNNVFMQYVKREAGFEQMKHGNIDFGGGLERIAAAANGDPDIFKTDMFAPIIGKLEELSGQKYDSDGVSFNMRVIADHIKAATFLIADGVVPSNALAGYVLRRLIRRAIRFGKLLGIDNHFILHIAEVVMSEYSAVYPELKNNHERIVAELEKEETKFRKALDAGLKEFNKLVKVTGSDAFNLYQSYGFPLEMTIELAHEKGIEVDKAEFEAEFQRHKDLSRTASAGAFKGGMADASEATTKYHTTTHLLLAALREVLGPETYQKGSNITAERLRFDFNYPDKMSPEQIKAVEDLVNQKIQAKIAVEMIEMPKAEALKLAKVSFDPAKYGDIVKVYQIDDFSIELCGGPHVANTGDLGVFKIQKEESSSAGVRRIKAVLE